MVSAARLKPSKMFDQVRERHEIGLAYGVDRSQESVLRQGTCRPAAGPVFTEPIVRNVVVDMVRIEQREKDIYIEKRNDAHSSSSAASTISIVTIRPGSCGSSGTPFRICGVRAG